jgi:pimeloyl-ACP methyl ester carboxylesterase
MTISYLERGEGRIAYDLTGAGPLVLLMHGMGVDRSVFRFTVPALVDAGFRVASMDLRGHGGSDATFSSYDDVAAASDAVALVSHLGGPAVLVGNSMGAGAAVIAAADHPSSVVGTVLIGPFVRNPPGSRVLSLLFRLALARPWGPALWRSYYRANYPTRRPDDFAAHVPRPRWRAFVRTTRTDHTAARDRLDAVTAPTLVVMGTRDRDWRDPAAEARFVAGSLRGELLLVEGAGHYPMAEFPEVVNPAVVAFARRVHTGG